MATKIPADIPIDFSIDGSTAGSRLDLAASDHIDSLARSRAAALIHSGKIRVNGEKKKPGYKVRKGDRVTGSLPLGDNAHTLISAEKIKLNIVFEDDWLIVVNKPPGMVVHPAAGNFSGTVVNALLHYYPSIRLTQSDPFRPGIVHRLDKDTSGLMVTAKTRHALAFLQKEFKQRRVEKKYLALVHGQMPDSRGRIDLPLGRHPVKRKLMAVRPEDGKMAVTEWRVVSQSSHASLVEVGLKTGRTHQIRVHFYALDHPLLGEKVYLPRRLRKKREKIGRQMLHSFYLSFRHPFSGQRVTFQADPPDDFIQVQNRMIRPVSNT